MEKVALVGLLWLAGCQPAAARPVTVPVCVSSAMPTSSSEFHLVTYPPSPHIGLHVEDAPPGVTRMTLGGSRVERRGEHFEFSAQALLDPFYGTCRGDGGWFHFTRFGEVYFSETFTGPIRDVGRKLAGVAPLECGPEFITENDASGAPLLWTRQGPRAVAESPVYRRAHFTNQREGEVVVVLDQLFATHDGGQHWELLPEASVPEWLSAQPPFEPAPVPEDEFGAFLRAWAIRSLASPAGRLVGATSLPDGSWFRAIRTRERAYLVQRKLDGQSEWLSLEGGCEHFASFGARVVAHCEQKPTLRVVLPRGAPALPASPDLRGLVVDARGRWVFGSTWVESGAALTRFDGNAWQTFPAVAGEPLELVGDWLLMDEPLRVVSAKDPTLPAHVIGPSSGAEQVRKGEVALLNHSLAYIEKTSHGASSLVEIELGSWKVLRRTPFPSRAGQLGMMDSEHAIAVGANSFPIALLTPGQSFQPLLGAVRIDDYWPDDVSCSKDACWVGESQVLTRESVEPEPGLVWPPARSDWVRPEPFTLVNDPGFEIGDYACTASPPPPTESASFAIGGYLDTVQSARALHWHAFDSNGAADVQTQTSETLAALNRALSDSPLEPEHAETLLFSRNFAVVSGVRAKKKGLFIVDPSGTSSGLIVAGAELVEALPLPDGGALLRAASDYHQELARLDARGVVVERRWLLDVSWSNSHFARRGEQFGLIELNGDVGRFFSLVPRADSVPVGFQPLRYDDEQKAPPRRPAPCLTARNPAAVSVFVQPPNPDGTSNWFFPAWVQPAFVEFEMNERRTCTRGVILQGPVIAELEARGGALQGRAAWPANTAVRCRKVPKK